MFLLRLFVGAVSFLFLAGVFSVEMAWARCGDYECLKASTAASCGSNCAFGASAAAVHVNNGASIGGVADGEGVLVGTVHSDRGQSILSLAEYDSNLHLVKRNEILRRPQTGKGELGNPHLLRGPGGGIYMAFRDHQLDEDRQPVFRLRVVRSADDGGTWQYLDDDQGIIDTSEVGLWEPFLYFDGKQQLRVVYAKERAEKLCSSQRGEKQDLVTRISKNLGKTWGEEHIVSSDGISRDGVPAITRLGDGSFLAVFESWQDGTCGKADPRLLIRSMQSTDGINWHHRQIVFDPDKTGVRSIATWPSVTLQPDGRAIVSFTSNFRNTQTNYNPKRRPETVRNFDIYLQRSTGPATKKPIQWESSSLTRVASFDPLAQQSNRFTSTITLRDGRIVVFSGLPNRFFVIQPK